MASLVPAPRRGPSAKHVLFLGSLAALPAITTDMYLPSLPAVATDLSTSDTAAQLTISMTLIGGMVGQLVIGPLSDRLGRRLPVLVGIGLHVLVSLACAVVPSIEWLIALRVLQGFCNAAATVVSMAVVRDRFVGSDAARLLSRLMLVIGLAPVLAPTVGGFIGTHWGWRGVFVVLAVIGAALWLVVWRWMPETLPAGRRTSPAASTSGYRVLARDKTFLALAAVPGLSLAVLMSYVVGSPFVLQQGFGLSAAQFAAVFAVNGVGMVLVAQLNAGLVRRFSTEQLLRVSLLVQAVTVVALLAVAVTGAGGLVGLLVTLWLVVATTGMVPANASALALSRHDGMAGTAAAVIGAAQSGVAGLIAPLVGVLGGGATAMATMMVVSVALSVVVVAAATTVFRGGDASSEDSKDGAGPDGPARSGEDHPR